MAFFRKSSKQNYDVLSGFSWYVPGVGGMFTMLALILAGALLGDGVALVCLSPFGKDAAAEYSTLIAYPVMFIPAMIYAKLKSNGNSAFETGYTMDSNKHFGVLGGIILAVLCMLGTICMAFDMDAVNALMPDMPKSLEDALNSLTQGNFWMNFLCVSIFAPFFEEWLCRGTVLRGLLNHKREDGTTMKPVWAILISAFFFAFIHLNPWQAIPAFGIGCLMGYVYYKTGSLKLTMLMHFANNTLALCAGQIDSLKDFDNWKDVMPANWYWLTFAAALLLLILFIRVISRIELSRTAGNSDEIPVERQSEEMA